MNHYELSSGHAERVRVLWISKGLNRGGAEILLRELSSQRGLDDFDLEIATVMMSDTDLVEDFERRGIPVHNLGASRTLEARWPLRLLRLIHRRNYAIVHSHSPLPASVTRLARLRPGCPVLITTEHNMPSAYAYPTRVFNGLTARLDHARIAVSGAVSRAFAENIRPEIVYHGVSLPDIGGDLDAERHKLRTKCGLTAGTKVVMTIANLRPEKNLHVLLDAFADVAKSVETARLVVIGDGEERKSLQKHADTLPSDRQPIFLGKVPEAWRYLILADVFALSSDEEGLPVSVMEAMSMGVPVVCTNVGGLSEIVTSGVDGFLVERGDAQGMASIITRLLSDPLMHARVAASGRGTVSRFSAEAAAERYRDLYVKLLSRMSHAN